MVWFVIGFLLSILLQPQIILYIKKKYITFIYLTFPFIYPKKCALNLTSVHYLHQKVLIGH